MEGIAMIDVKVLTDEELAALRLAVAAERSRRQVLTSAPMTMEQLQAQYIKAIGRVDGGAWVQPGAGALDVYKLGDKVTCLGKTWESLIDNNVTQPGNPADPQAYRWWKDMTTPPADNTWDGNGHKYTVGDSVTYQGNTYKVLQSHTSQPGWNPSAVPALYQLVAA